MEIGNIRKGVDYLSGFQGQSNTAKIQGEGIPSEMSVRRTFLKLLGSLKFLRNYLMRRRGQTWSYWQLLLPSKTFCKVYDEIWYPQLAWLWRLYENDCSSSNVNSTDENKSKRSISNEILSQNYYAEVDKLCSTEIDKSEYTHVPNFNVSNVF